MIEDVYDDEYLDVLMDNDEITPEEAGILHWIDVDEERSFGTLHPRHA